MLCANIQMAFRIHFFSFRIPLFQCFIRNCLLLSIFLFFLCASQENCCQSEKQWKLTEIKENILSNIRKQFCDTLFYWTKKNGIKCLWKTMKTFSYLNYFNMRFIYYLLIKFHLNLMFITSSMNENMFKYCIRLFDFYFSEFYDFVMEWF